MKQVLKQVLREKAEELESLKVRMRPYARADQLERERMNQVCCLLQDTVRAVLMVLNDDKPRLRDPEASRDEVKVSHQGKTVLTGT